MLSNTLIIADRSVWTVYRTRQLVSRRPFHYAAIDVDGQTLSIAGDAKFTFIRDSEIPVVSDEEKEEASGGCYMFYALCISNKLT